MTPMKCIVRNITAVVSTQPPFSIRDISFALKEGQVLAIIGPSGAGKSSLLHALAGFLPVQHGAIILDDNTVSCASFCLPPQERNMGIIFQDHNLLPHLTLFENMTLGMGKEEVIEKSKEIRSMFADLQLGHLRDMLPQHTSGGQQQRIALGRAILHNKKLLLFDEPFSGLDRKRMIQLAQTIRESVTKYKRSAVLVTHHLDEALLIADQIGIMEEGSIREIALPDQVYHRPRYLSTAEYVGPSTVIEGKRKNKHSVNTMFGLVQTANPIPAAESTVKLLTRPDDYLISSGKEYMVSHILFSGMTQMVTVTSRKISMKVSLEHHMTVSQGDRVGVQLKADHPYVAYNPDGIQIGF